MKELQFYDLGLIERTDLTVGQDREPLSEREIVVYQLVELGLAEIDSRYGPQGIRPQASHNSDHGLDVIDGSTQLGDAAILAGKIEPADKDLLILGGCFHDIERDFGSGLNEAASARIICQLMRASGQFSDKEVARVYKMIMATEVYMLNGVMHQSAEPGDYLQQLLADADLSTLGRTPRVYWERALRYAKELAGKSQLDDEAILAFALDQEVFLRNHTFYTEEANQLFPYKQANIRFTQFMQRFYAGKHLPGF